MGFDSYVIHLRFEHRNVVASGVDHLKQSVHGAPMERKLGLTSLICMSNIRIIDAPFHLNRSSKVPICERHVIRQRVRLRSI